MKHKYSFLLAVALICASIVLVSCRSATVRRTSSHEREHVYVQGPPPHAPAINIRIWSLFMTRGWASTSSSTLPTIITSRGTIIVTEIASGR
jgi:hypothetical protein